MITEVPYPGLHPFDCGEADVFFGREEQTDQLLDKLGKYRFLAVVGPSGCGKSSLVRAGLISNLSGGFMASAGARWRVAVMRPGKHPMRRLTEALLGEKALGPERGDSANAHGFLGATLWRGPLGLVEALRETPLPPDTNLLLLVDQFEEIFRFRSEEERDEADAFVALMVESAEQPEQSIYVVMTMRSDYIGDCGQFQGLPEHVSKSQFLTSRLSREQREDAITGPARVFGGDVDEALVNRLLNETSSDPDHLPVLQHLLMRMWNRALQECESKGAGSGGALVDAGPYLTVEHYNAVGGMKSALSNHANEAYVRLSDAQRKLAEIMFRRLCELGSNHMYTRRPTSIQEIAKVAGVAPKWIMEVAEVFREARTNFIVPGHPEPLLDSTYLDISHESLIRQWDKLRDWAWKEADSAKTYQHLAFQAELWDRGAAALWVTPNLETAQKWQKDGTPNKAWASRYGGDFDLAIRFLEASEEAQEREREEKEAAQRERERNLQKLAEAEKQRAEAERLRADQQFKLAEAEGERARQQLRLAEAERKRAEQQEQFATAQRQRAKDQEAAAKRYWRVAVAAGVLLVIAAATSVYGWIREDQASQAEAKATELAAQAKIAESQAKIAESKALKGQAKLVAILSQQALEKGNNRKAMGIPLEMFARNLDRLNTPAAKSGSSDLSEWFLEPENALFRMLYRPVGVVLEDTARVYSANFSDDGNRVVTASDDGTVRIWDATTGNPVGETIQSDGQARFASFDPEGRRIVVAYWNASSPSGSTAKIWDRREKQFVRDLHGHTAPLNLALFSHDGARILTASFDETARLWDARTGEQIIELKGHDKGVLWADIDTTGTRIVTASFDNTARIWNAETGEQLGKPLVHPGAAISAKFDKEGKYIVTASMDGSARVWDAEICEIKQEPCKPFRILRGHRKPVSSAMFSGDGTRVLTGSNDKTVRIWDWKKEETLLALQGPPSAFGWRNRAVFNPAEDRLLTMFGGTSAYIWNLKKLDLVAPIVLKDHDSIVKFAEFNVTGDRVVTASLDKTARVWDLSDGRPVLTLEHRDPVFSASFDPAGRWIITAAGKAAHIWDASDGKFKHSLDGHEGRLFSAAFSPDGDRAVTASIDGTARVWESETGEELMELVGHAAPVTYADFAPGGKRVVTASTDRTARIWDPATGGALQVLRGHDGTVMSAKFDAAGNRIVTASVDKTVRIWDAESGVLLKTFQSDPDEPFESAAFSPDGRYLAAAASDGTVRIMGVASGATLATLHRHGGAVKWAGYDAAGRQIVTASADGTARVWQVPGNLESRMEFACRLLDPLTDEEQKDLGAACSGVRVSAR